MSAHRKAPSAMRLWHKRRRLWRIALVLVSLSFISLAGVLWSLFLDTNSVLRRGAAAEAQRVVQPPPDYDGDRATAGPDGKIPFRRPTKAPSTATDETAAVTPSALVTPWHDNGNVKKDAHSPNRKENTPTPFDSDGAARVVLACATDREVGSVVAYPPRLLARGVTWAAYHRFVESHGRDTGAAAGDDDAAAAEEKEDAARDPAKQYVRPLRKVEVQLRRQRTSRGVWAEDGEEAEAIVGVFPAESAVLSSADELLVEEHLRAEDQSGASPDPSRLVPLTATTRRSETAVSEASLHIDTAARAVGRTSEAPLPLVELRSVRRSSLATSLTAARTAARATTGEKGEDEASLATTVLTWRAGGVRAAHPLTVDVALDVVHPRRDAAHPGEVFAESVQATVCSSRVVRLYGVVPHVFGAAGGDGIASIPLNLTKGIEVMVGGPVGGADGAQAAGVVPLLYLDLDASYAARPSSAAADRRTVGLLWLHPAPFILSTATTATRTCVRLRSTAGATKLFLLPGPTPVDVLRQYYTLTGFPTLPPRFVLGYHHGMHSAAAATETAMEALSGTFRRTGTPLDSVWATASAVSARDTPFTWNLTRFPDALRLQSNLWYDGRRYVVVRTVPTVPITSRSPLFLEGRREGFFVTLSAGELAGWPTHSIDGVPSHVVDFANPAARRWYGNMLKYRRYVGSSNHTFVLLQHAAPHVWSEEAEQGARQPSACARAQLRHSGELLPMDVGHRGGLSHREVHQLLPVAYARAAHEGMLRRTQYVRRALVLTENFYAGVQRYAVVPVETQLACAAAGVDSVVEAAWRQLEAAVRHCGQLGVLGVPFNGANLGAGLSVQLARHITQKRGAAQAGLGVATPPLPQTEAEEVLVRWYQAGMFMGLMHTVERNAEEGEKETAAGEATPSSQPWWMRLPLHPSTREAVVANVKARYALLPYLYTAAHNASEHGSPFLAPLTFVDPAARQSSDRANASICYAVGDALVFCPVTRRAAVPRVGEMFDLWTGEWGVQPLAPSASSGAPLSWLLPSAPAVERAGVTTPPPSSSAALAPAFLRAGRIVATQNVVQSAGEEEDAVRHDAVAVHSTNMGANWSMTVALPALPPPTHLVPEPLLLAEGTVFWDEGSHNSQQHPPAPKPGVTQLLSSYPVIPTQVHHCLLRLRCFYENRDGRQPHLRLEVSQTSPSCAEAMAELQWHWREEPQGFAERLALAEERRAARQHALEKERDAQEDKGLRGRHGAGRSAHLQAQNYTDDDLNGLRLPSASAAQAARDELWSTHLLHRIRFLFQRQDDAARLARFPGDTVAAARRSSVSVERHGLVKGGEAAEGRAVVTGSVMASRSAPSSAEVLVELTDCTSCTVAAAEAFATTSVFGAVRTPRRDGTDAAHVPQTNSWSFVFPLLNKE